MVLCSRDCGGELSPRASRNCCLPDFDTNEWGTGGRDKFPREYMGRSTADGFGRPPEDPSEGCPAGWITARFVLSLHRYRREMDDHGHYIANAFYDRCEDRFVLEAITALEDEERHARAIHIEQVRKLYDSD